MDYNPLFNNIANDIEMNTGIPATEIAGEVPPEIVNHVGNVFGEESIQAFLNKDKEEKDIIARNEAI